jgi:hypothetical protein
MRGSVTAARRGRAFCARRLARRERRGYHVASDPATCLTIFFSSRECSDLPTSKAAHDRVRGRVVLTPCTPSEAFGEMFGGRAWFKFENLQRTGSFKERGALNCMLSIPEAERARGVIAASAGNHAQGVAFHARRLGIPATIVMPERTPLVKVSNTEKYGARVVLHGVVYDEAMAEALRIQRGRGAGADPPLRRPGDRGAGHHRAGAAGAVPRDGGGASCRWAAAG